MRFDEYEFNDEMEQLAWEMEEQELFETDDELAYQMESLYENEYGTPRMPARSTQNRSTTGRRPVSNYATQRGSGQQGQSQQPARCVSFTINPSGQRCLIIACFAFAKFDVPRDSVKALSQLARQIITSQSSSSPIRLVQISGYTDPRGGAGYNEKLGWQRATVVKQLLVNVLDRLKAGASRQVKIDVKSLGESQQDTSGNHAANRKVVICWYQGKKPNNEPIEQDKDKATCVTINNFCCPTEKQAESTCCSTGSQAPAATQAAITAASKCLQELAEKMKEQAEPEPQTACCSCGRKH